MEDLERKLLHRLLEVPGISGYRTQILVGQLPGDVTFSLPAGTRVLGSLERRVPPQLPSGGMNLQDHIQIELEAPQQAEVWLADFTARLDEHWQRRPVPGFHRGGFLPAEQLENRQWYSARQAQSLTLNVRAFGRGCEAALSLNGMTPEQARHWDNYFQDEPAGPELRVPPGMTVYPGGGGGGGGTMTYSSVLEGAVPPPDLMAHFAQQLKAQGWDPVSEGQQGTLWAGQWVRQDHELAFLNLKQLETGFQATLVLTGRQPHASRAYLTG